jgi:hypothetical protein
MLRIDSVVEAERERRRPPTSPPPPISEEHAALRRQIATDYRTLLDPEDPEGTAQLKRINETPSLSTSPPTYLRSFAKRVSSLRTIRSISPRRVL